MKKLLLLFVTFFCLQASLLAQDTEAQPAEQPGEDNEKVPEKSDEKVEKLDLIFAIDASGSVAWTDPAKFRTALVNSIIDITQKKGGDRIAVIQFAGWNETKEMDPFIFNLRTIPKEPKLREFILLEIKNAVNTRLSSSGVATDFNYLFNKAFREVLDKRGESENKMWLVIISDGSMEVVEGDDVREAYRARLDAESVSVNRPNLNRAAMEMFEEETLPLFAAIEDLYITCVNLGEGEPGDAMKKIVELPNANLMNTSQGNLKSVMVEMFARSPQEFPDYGLTRGFAYVRETVAPASEIKNPFRIYEGAVSTNLLLLGNTDEFSVDLKYEDGESIIEKPSVTTFGKGGRYRLIEIVNEKHGQYELLVTSDAGTTAVFEFLQYGTFDLTPYVDVSKTETEYYPGESILLDVGLRDTRTGGFISDHALIRQAEIILSVTNVDGDIDEKIVGFIDTSTAEATAAFTLPEDSPGGEYLLEIRAGAIRDTVTGEYAYISEPVRISFSVLSPVVELSFASPEALLAQEIEIVGNTVQGALADKQKEKGIEVSVVHPASKTEKTVHLSWNKESGKLSGVVAMDRLEEWRLRKSPLGTGQVKPVEPAEIMVRPRELRVLRLDREGKKVPVDKLTLAGGVEEPATANLIVETDLLPGEEAILTYSKNMVDKSASLDVSISGETGTTTGLLTSQEPSSVVSLKLTLTSYPEKKEIGQFVINAQIAGVEFQKQIPVVADITEKPFPWPYLVGAGLLLLLIIILLLVLTSGPGFDQQQLYIVGGSGHHLSEWKTGKKTAVGTAEIPGTIYFRLKGGRKNPVCMVMPGDNTRIFVNNIESTYWTEVHHGDYIEIYPTSDEYSYRYRYFERNPTSGELSTSEQMTEEVGAGIFLGEDEFILADDDEDLAADTGTATQELLEQAKKLKEGEEYDQTEILVQGSGREYTEAPETEGFGREESYEETEIIREAAKTEVETDYTESVPSMPGEASEYFQEDVEEIDSSEILSIEEESPLFNEIAEEEGPAEEGFSLPFSEEVEESEATEMIMPEESLEVMTEPTEEIDEGIEFEEMESEPTQAIAPEDSIDSLTEPTEEIVEGIQFEEVESEPTQAIAPEDSHEATTEPTEEIEDDAVEEMTEMVEERMEMSEFIEEEEEHGEGGDLADELDRTFDQILGEEEND